MKVIYLSTVTPVYRGVETLRALVGELESLRLQLIERNSPLRLSESIFVDDDSSDGSEALLTELADQRDWIQIIRLSRNFGQHPATMAGILHAGGDWIATLDEDLQHRPADVLKLLRRAVVDQCDVVYAVPEKAVHQSVYRDWGSRCYKRVIAFLSGNPHVVRFNSFRLMRASVARAAAAVAAHQTYFDVALCWFTSRIGVTPLDLVDGRYVESRRSGYSFRSLMAHARRLLESSEVKAVRFGAGLGFLAMLLSAVTALATVVLKLVAPRLITLQGWASVMVAILFFGGLISVLLGLVLELLSILVMQSHGKPTFFEINRHGDGVLRQWFAQTDGLL